MNILALVLKNTYFLAKSESILAKKFLLARFTYKSRLSYAKIERLFGKHFYGKLAAIADFWRTTRLQVYESWR